MWKELPHGEIHQILVGWVVSEKHVADDLILIHFRCCNKEEFYFFRSPAIKPPGTGKKNVIRCFTRRIPNQNGTLSDDTVLLHWEFL